MKDIEKIKKYKEEFIKRYKYLYENLTYILSPFVFKENDNEIKKRINFWKEKGLKSVNPNPYIGIKKIDEETIRLLEKFLLEDCKIEDTEYYNKLESLKCDKDYLEKVKIGCEWLKERSDNIFSKNDYNLWKILSDVRNFIFNQSGDLKNRRLKLEVLDSYFNLDRYKNDGKVWNSGYNLTFNDTSNYDTLSAFIAKDEKKFIPNRNREDVGVGNNGFINCFSNTSIIKNTDNRIRLTEEEKQAVYLCLHDELPWNLSIRCEESGLWLERPNTSFCNQEFNIKEDEIFIDNNGKFYHLCPNCGYIVLLRDVIFSDGIRQRITDRCNNDGNLFRKMLLYSELKYLDSISNEKQKKMLKK